jgi:hypothetical protein
MYLKLEYRPEWIDIGGGRLYRGTWLREENLELFSNRHVTSLWLGIGQIRMKDGSTYKGEVSNGLIEGRGRMEHANGDIYQGEWRAGKTHGKGVFCDTKGSMYSGEWLDD